MKKNYNLNNPSQEIINATKNDLEMVNLDKMTDSSVLLSTLEKHFRIMYPLCFKNGGSLVRFNIFKMFVQHIWSINKNHGSTHVVQYLKGCHLAIQKFVAGEPVSSLKVLLGPGVYPCLREGLPKFIPLVDRNLIRGLQPAMVRYYLTLFSLYRVLDCKRVLKLSTITKPFDGDEKFLEDVLEDSKSIIRNHFKRPIQGAFSTLKKFSFLESASNPGVIKTSWLELRTKAWALRFSHLWESFDSLRQMSLNSELNAFFDTIVSISPPLEALDIKGHLCSKDEPAGKVRIFAMVDIWTQNVLKPFHNAFFAFLRSCPNDGTFDQWSAVYRGVEKAQRTGTSFGYDLSAATDRLPVSIQAFFIDQIFGNKVGSNWRNLLVGREYELNSPQYGFHTVSYAVGQPMGALSSWAMLALSHHLIVQVAYKRTRNGYDWYTNYELLGDDIVIFDKDIAETYLSIMKGIGLEINLSKSVCSPTGDVVEFAKKTMLKGENVSALPWKAFMSQNNLTGKASLAYSLHNRIGHLSTISALKRFYPTKMQIIHKLFMMILLKIFSSNTGKWNLLIFKLIAQKYGTLNMKTLEKIPLNYLEDRICAFLKGDFEILLHGQTWMYYDMYKFSNMWEKSIRRLRSVDGDCRELSRQMLNKLFPEFRGNFDTASSYYYNENIEAMFDCLVRINRTNLDAFLADIPSGNRWEDLDLLLEKSVVIDNYFQYLDLVKRADEKIQKISRKPVQLTSKSLVKQMNKWLGSPFSAGGPRKPQIPNW